MICQGCVIKDHNDHISDCIPIDRNMLDNYIKNVLKYLLKQQERISALIETCQKLSETEIAISSKDFFSLTRIIQSLLGIDDRA